MLNVSTWERNLMFYPNVKIYDVVYKLPNMIVYYLTDNVNLTTYFVTFC
jgi:hypothetical protein